MSEPHILEQTDDLLVLDKPAGWLTHPAGTDAPDVQSWLAGRGLADFRPVHRLDAPTSGVLLFARGDRLQALGDAFAARSVHKTYVAVVHGRARRKGIIRRKLADGRRGRPLEAVSRYRTVRWVERRSVVQVRPETGRKHQIRRHLASVGHPLVGDGRYGRRTDTEPMILHCLRLQVGDETWEAPLPPALAALLATPED